MHHPSFRRLTWNGEPEQHFMPAASSVVAGAPMLCGKRLPPFEDVDGDEEGVFKEIPLCRRCSRARSNIFRHARRAFAADVVRDLDSLPTVDAAEG
jgi:hypothetical protein